MLEENKTILRANLTAFCLPIGTKHPLVNNCFNYLRLVSLPRPNKTCIYMVRGGTSCVVIRLPAFSSNYSHDACGFDCVIQGVPTSYSVSSPNITWLQNYSPQFFYFYHIRMRTKKKVSCHKN